MAVRFKMGVTHVRTNFEKLASEIRAKMPEIVKEITEEVAATYQDTVRTGIRTGREYDKHRASAPDEPPANLTGELAGSVRISYSDNGETGFVKVESWYSKLLEFGCKRFAARPAMRPIMMNIAPKFKKATRKLVKDSAKANEVREVRSGNS